jgi:hypothetical protein
MGDLRGQVAIAPVTSWIAVVALGQQVVEPGRGDTTGWPKVVQVGRANVVRHGAANAEVSFILSLTPIFQLSASPEME